jgi:hypothetical protein
LLIGVHGRPTRRSDWQNHPPKRTVELRPASTVYPWRMWPNVYFGLYPEVMEDKWFAFMEHRHLRVHRSWTGHPIYELAFQLRPEGFLVERLRVVDEPDVYTPGPERYEQLMTDWFVWWAFRTLPEDRTHAGRLWDQAWRANPDA